MPTTGDNRQPIAFPAVRDGDELPAAWRELIRYCRDLRFGEIERLSIQDGLPVMAETIRKKVRFGRRP
jgi:hypothetical protein